MVVWLVDHNGYRPPPEYRVRLDDVKNIWYTQNESSPFFNENSTPEEREKANQEVQDIVRFQHRVFVKAGLGEEATFLPPSIHPAYCGSNPKTDLASAYEECKMAICGAVDGLLKKIGLQPKDVDILVTTCSIFCPTPSMASMVVNHFKMRSDVHSYHLGGMGCSNGVVAVNLVKDLLKAHPNSNAIFVTNETTTPAFYRGQDKHRLVTNVLFRMGANASLISDKRCWQGRAKYKLDKALRVHTGQSDDAYRCIWYGPDSKGHNGVALGLNVIDEATRAMTAAITKVAPSIMTWHQIFTYLYVELVRRCAKMSGTTPPPRYVPCFAEGVEHFLLHAGGAKVLDGMGKALKLQEHELEPSRAVLADYGNVSSSTTWYTLAFIESLRGVKKGDKVLQVGVGSGVKCGINVWKAVRDVDDLHDTWAHRVDPERHAAIEVATTSYNWRGQAIRRALCFFVVLLLALVMYACMTTNLVQQQPGNIYSTAAHGLLSLEQRLAISPFMQFLRQGLQQRLSIPTPTQQEL